MCVNAPLVIKMCMARGWLVNQLDIENQLDVCEGRRRYRIRAIMEKFFLALGCSLC